MNSTSFGVSQAEGASEGAPAHHDSVITKCRVISICFQFPKKEGSQGTLCTHTPGPTGPVHLGRSVLLY